MLLEKTKKMGIELFTCALPKHGMGSGNGFCILGAVVGDNLSTCRYHSTSTPDQYPMSAHGVGQLIRANVI
jgi:hypothetical protein